MKIRRRVAAAAVGVLALTGGMALLTTETASGHGAAMKPGSRTYLCWKYGLRPQGGFDHTNAACAAAVGISGTNSLYNWFAVLRSDAGGRTSGFVPDGRLCSGGAVVYDFEGFNLARDDWPVTHLTAGANYEFNYSNWAHHPGRFDFYVTKDGFNPNSALKWSDLESEPFLSVTNPPQSGSVGSNEGHYYWTGRLPNKSGRHIIYSHWVRSDSNENFYGCSDVVFDGGSGQVTGFGSSTFTTTSSTTTRTTSTSSTSSTTTTRTTSTSSTPTTTTTRQSSSSTGTGSGGCTATYSKANEWPGGFQGNVNVRNDGSSSISGWTVTMTFPNGQSVSQLWGGKASTSGSSVTVTNEGWNGGLSASGQTSFGFIGSWNGSNNAPTVSCSAR